MRCKVRACCLLAAISLSPMPVSAMEFSGGGYHVIRIESGEVKGLGDGTYGQLGSSPAGVPSTVAGLTGVTDVAAGGFSTLVLNSNGTVWFLGESALQHTTPHGTPNPATTPVQVAGLSEIDSIAAGHRHFLALDSDTGNLYAWGHNGSGQVGNGGLLDLSTPVVVLTGVTSMSAGDGFSLATKGDGTLWAWGRNSHGQLGLGDTADRLSPVQVPGVTTAEAVAAGGQHSLIRLADGSILATGNNAFGQLGLGNTTSISTPTAVPGLSGVIALSAGYFHSAALGPGTQVSLWGRNFEGQCGGGNSSPVTYTSPQVLSGISGTPTGIECGYHFTLIERSDGSFLGTGSNSDGQLDGTSVADQDDSQKILAPQTIPLVPEAIPPGLSSTSPTNGASGVLTATALVMAFDEVVQKGSGNILIKENLGNAVVATIDIASSNVTISGAEVTITLPSNLSTGTAYYVEMANGAIMDLSGNSFAGIAGLATWSFITEVAPSSGARPITNHSFEADENTDTVGAFATGSRANFGGELTGWTAQSDPTTGVPAGASPAVGWKDVVASELDPFPAASGQESQAMSLQAGSSVLNTTSTTWSSLREGDEITLTISLGMRVASTGLNWNEGTFFGLTDSDADLTTISLADTVANSGLITNNPATGTQSGDGSFTDVSFSHTVQAADLSRNGNIGILIYSEGSGASGASNQSFFDNVRLDLSVAPAGDFATYMADSGFGIDTGKQGFDQDPDGDGLANGLEAWFGTHPGEFSAGIANLATDGNTTTLTHPQNEQRPADIIGYYEWSPNLVDWYACDGVDGPPSGGTVIFSVATSGATTTIKATASEALQRFFVRAGVVRN